ncbi:uncharacterized protein TRAVEDRAFT_149078 [Trametes versicolor FP-101664 SS1]|uniref:uncharacterized protein n=1 Tax=Trametes versicolor (strain FP-101664) TaxID=717944 RepID=UPI0004622E40|nr:uncharacterized protein TRAVEDRAFT_149078 [Trametes versicolor FP-101664 SS1]EIW58723.1 hypothetical protein TRAVEDRAFT_149078 [Trametes versicolor FP-101664 SS1]
MATALGPPAISFLRPTSSLSSFSDSGSVHNDHDHSGIPRFPHTRAQLAAIARQYKPDGYGDAEGDVSAVSSSFVGRVVGLLDGEREDDVKSLLKDTFGPSIPEDELEQHVLDLMHKHRDDIDNVPFLFLTPTRRPISRPSSRASTHSARLIPNRPDTPNSAPSSPLAMIFRRPHTPLTSPLGIQAQSNSYISARSESPGASPIFTHAQFAVSLPSSPMSSPRLLNAKASEFRPIPRPLSAASSNPGSLAALRADTPSPDMWAPPSRPTSKLAIAAPLTPDNSLLPRAFTPTSSLRSSMRPDEHDDDDDPFDPFAARPIPRSFHSSTSDELLWGNSPISSSSLSADDMPFHHVFGGTMDYDTPPKQKQDDDMDPEVAAMLTDGMTPFDVLSSVFGATLAPSELEEALAANGYDFERAMTWLVDRSLTNHTAPSQPRVQSVGNRVMVVQRDGQSGIRGGRAAFHGPQGRNGGRFVNGRPAPGGNRVCRYFLAGECLRADCRFSHDLERALCRFWLRGTCAKGETCEFLHHLPQEIDVSGLNGAMSRMDIHGGQQETNASAPLDEFPSLNHAIGSNNNRRGGHGLGRGDSSFDPSRTRFAAAVKRPAPQSQIPKDPATLAARREAMGSSAEPLHPNTAIVAPKPSPRIKLKSPSLLPTLPTGEAVNKLYMTYRERALRLGAARNACLSRAADAWRRGDGAAAKRFSREGHDLNAKMAAEMVEAAGKLVRERARLAEQAARARDVTWSDDPGDRSVRGRVCGAGLGITLGIASQTNSGETKLTPEERTEAMLDLHGLHAAEATEVLEEFLLALERENFYGLAFLIVGEEKHTGTQDPSRGASKTRLATGVREWLHMWGYPWSERDGVICVDPLTHG